MSKFGQGFMLPYLLTLDRTLSRYSINEKNSTGLNLVLRSSYQQVSMYIIEEHLVERPSEVCKCTSTAQII